MHAARRLGWPIATALLVLIVMACSAPGSSGPIATRPVAVGSATAATPSPSPSPSPTIVPSPTVPAVEATPVPSLGSDPEASAAIPAEPTPEPTPDPTEPAERRLRTFPLGGAADCGDLPAEHMPPLTLIFNEDDPSDAARLTDRSDWIVHVAWPAGFSVTGDEPVLRDERGDIVGRQGDEIRLHVEVTFPGGGQDDPAIAEGVLFGRCYRRAVEFRPGTVLVVVVDGLRLRAAPGTDSGSPVIADVAPGAKLEVLDGPVTDDGFDWYRVEPRDPTTGVATSGWVAVGPTGSTTHVERALPETDSP